MTAPRRFRWLPTPDRQAEIDAHWANVRAGLHVPQDHVFSLDVPAQIHARNKRIEELFKAIAHEMREIEKLALVAKAEGDAA